MATWMSDIISTWYEGIVSILPIVIGAILILLIGWIVGRLLGKGVRLLLDKLNVDRLFHDSAFVKALSASGITISYVFDVAVRLFVYLIAVLAAVDLLNLDYLSALMKNIIEYIPHVVVFMIIVLVGFILIDFFSDFLAKFHTTAEVHLIEPILLLMRVFLYFVVAIFALSQLQLDLTIIYTFLTPIAWGLGIGLGAAIAIIFGFGLKDRSTQLMDQLINAFTKK